MRYTSEAVEALVENLTRLPSIGRKTAQRLASHILKMPRSEVVSIAEALVNAKDRVKTCTICFNVADESICSICSSTRRNHNVVCVVEEPNDVMALERTNDFRGVYHVLGGAISPLDGVGPDDLNITELISRVANTGDAEQPIGEIILAMNPNVEGDTTAYYLAQLLKPFETKVTRIARGLPIGGDLEYADEATLSRALEGRDSF